MGVSEERIHVLTDVELALKMLPKDGIALICGTGSIAMGKKGERIFREGGLGPIWATREALTASALLSFRRLRQKNIGRPPIKSGWKIQTLSL